MRKNGGRRENEVKVGKEHKETFTTTVTRSLVQFIHK